MADIADLSDERIELATQASVATIRANVPTGPYAGDCEECGGPIAKERANAGYRTCIECAEILANADRMHGRGVYR